MKAISILELLSPAKDADHGIAAINFGADAVYIGAPRFSARASAGSSPEEIERLCKYAHKFDAKVFVAFNTLLFEKELEEAENIIHQVYNAGADALIIQDMGILEMNLPPIALHASTQAHNASVAKAEFLEKAGFARAVLARELSLEQIREIRNHSKMELEAFVHGALCVSYSGQCWMSAHLGNRSGNRGECAQSCRLKFSLLDKEGQSILPDQNILSIKDMNRSDYILQMAKAGITSFKIEGRLKDINYVKNITAHYRKLLDDIMQKDATYKPASRGNFLFEFEPDPDKTFNRAYTDYLTEKQEAYLRSPSPKSTGKWLGQVQKVGKGYFTLDHTPKLVNGDGICFPDHTGELVGFSVNRTEGDRIFHPPYIKIRPGMDIYRNQDQEFIRKLSNTKQCRYIEVDLTLTEEVNGFGLLAKTTDGDYCAASFVESDKQPAQNPERAKATVFTQLAKTGSTIFSARNIETDCKADYFIPIPILNQLRREALDLLYHELGKNYKREELHISKNNFPYPQSRLDYTANISNSLALLFYKRHGVTEFSQAFELSPDKNSKVLMTTKYCIKYEMGICPHHQKPAPDARQPAYIAYKDQKFLLDFDCSTCRMLIKS